MRKLAEVLEVDVNKLKQSAADKQETISNLSRSLKLCNERIPNKEREIQDVKDVIRELNKELGVLTASIVRLEQATQPLTLRIQEQKNLYEQVTIYTFYIPMTMYKSLETKILNTCFQNFLAVRRKICCLA